MKVTAEQASQFVAASVPAIGRLGIVVEKFEIGEIRLRMPLEDNANHMGTMYAGALFSIAELPGGVLPLTVLDPSKYVPIVVSMDVRFKAAARTDVTVDARVSQDDLLALARRVDDEGKAEFVLDLEVVDANDTVVMTSHGVYQLRPARQ